MNSPPENEVQSLEDFIEQHSEPTNDGTSTWTYRFNARGHDVLFLIASAPESAAIITAAAASAGLTANVHETIH